MSKFALKAVALGIAMALLMPAYAQQGGQDKNAVATLQVNKGVVMTSTGGEFASGVTGQELVTDERLMVTKDSSATVVYNDHCKRTYDDPGVYKIDANCKAAAWLFGGSATEVAIIAGGVIGGIIIYNHGHHHHPMSR